MYDFMLDTYSINTSGIVHRHEVLSAWRQGENGEAI